MAREAGRAIRGSLANLYCGWVFLKRNCLLRVSLLAGIFCSDVLQHALNLGGSVLRRIHSKAAPFCPESIRTSCSGGVSVVAAQRSAAATCSLEADETQKTGVL